MPGFDFVARDGPRRPCLDSAEGTTLDAWDLNISRDWITGHAQMMLKRRFRGILDNSRARVVCRSDQCGRHRRRNADLSLASALRGGQCRIMLAEVPDRRCGEHALADLILRKLAAAFA